MSSKEYGDMGVDGDGADVSLMGHRDSEAQADKPWTEDHVGRTARGGRASRWKQTCAAVMSVRSILDGVLLVVILVLLVERSWGSQGPVSQPQPTEEFQGTGDLTGFAPRSECSGFLVADARIPMLAWRDARC
jgi:hypothetical protein